MEGIWQMQDLGKIIIGIKIKQLTQNFVDSVILKKYVHQSIIMKIIQIILTLTNNKTKYITSIFLFYFI